MPKVQSSCNENYVTHQSDGRKTTIFLSTNTGDYFQGVAEAALEERQIIFLPP